MNSYPDSSTARARPGAADTEALLRRLRLLSAFAHLDENARRAVLAAGEVLELGSGDAVCTAGQHDPHVHHLLEGTLAIRTGDGGSLLLRAGEGPAREALDEPGAKTATIVAAPSARVFRIDGSRLQATLAAAGGGTVPPADYTDTFSGQQLARLVGELRSEHKDIVDPAATRGAPAERLLGERTLGFEIAAPDLESTRPPPDLESTRRPSVLESTRPPAPESVRPPALESSRPPAPESLRPPALEDTRPPVLENTRPPPVLTERAAAPAFDPSATITRAFEAELRRQVAEIRATETARANTRLKAYAEKLKQQAETQLRTKLKTLAGRYEAAYQTREQALRKRYEQLLAQANLLARQKADLYQGRRQHHAYVERSAGQQREFAELAAAMLAELDALQTLPGFEDDLAAVAALLDPAPTP